MTVPAMVAMVWPMASYLVDEMQERGWTTADVALRMGGSEEYGVRLLSVEMVLAIDDDSMTISDDIFVGLARAFDVSEEMLRNLDAAWRRHPASRVKIEIPDELFSGEFPTKH